MLIIGIGRKNRKIGKRSFMENIIDKNGSIRKTRKNVSKGILLLLKLFKKKKWICSV